MRPTAIDVVVCQCVCLLDTMASPTKQLNRSRYHSGCRLRCAYTHPFNDPLSRTTRVSRCQKGKTNLDFTEATDSEWQWHQLDHMQVCTSLQTDNHASTPLLSFLQAGCPSCRPANSIKALKATKVCPRNLILGWAQSPQGKGQFGRTRPATL